jgi:hypothetical protein
MNKNLLIGLTLVITIGVIAAAFLVLGNEKEERTSKSVYWTSTLKAGDFYGYSLKYDRVAEA